MKKFFTKLFTLGELIIGFAFVILALGGIFATFFLNALIGVAGFFIVLDGLEHIDDPTDTVSATPPSDEKNKEGK